MAKHRLDFGRQQLGLQEPFLANTTNKNNFITLLGQYVTDMGVAVHQALGDADTLAVVSVALEKALNGQMYVSVLAEDTDILVLLLHHWQQCMNVFFLP